MKAGAGKAKGSAFERKIAKELSLWISAGKDKDLLWRTALSGGRASTGKATIGFGDLGVVKHTEESAQFYRTLCVELKNYQEVSITKAFHNPNNNLWQWWHQVSGEATKAGLTPMLIAKGNRQPALLILPNYVDALCRGERIIRIPCVTMIPVQIFHYERFINDVKWSDLFKVLPERQELI